VIKQSARVLEYGEHSVELLCFDSPGGPWLADCALPLHAVGPSSAGYDYTPKLIPWLREYRHSFDAIIIYGLWQLQRIWHLARAPQVWSAVLHLSSWNAGSVVQKDSLRSFINPCLVSFCFYETAQSRAVLCPRAMHDHGRGLVIQTIRDNGSTVTFESPV
jgi:hypothetical protein